VNALVWGGLTGLVIGITFILSAMRG